MSEVKEQNNNNLPEGWKWVRLGDLVDDPKQDLVDGPFGSNLKAHEYVESGVPVFKIQNIKANRFVDKNINYVTEEKAKELSRHSFKSGDLIITKLGDPLGLCCKVPAKYTNGIIVADLMRLRPSKKKVYDNYLVNVINSKVVQNQFKVITKGTTRQRVNLTIVRDIKIPLPSIEEQKQIVFKIEELFSELDKSVEELKTAQQQLKVYRLAVLNNCIIEDNLTTIESIVEKLDQGWSPKCYNEVSQDQNEWAVIKTTAVQAGVFLDNENKRLPERLDPRKQHELKVGDLLITRAGPRIRVGVCCMIRKTRPRLLNSDKVYRIKTNLNVALPAYIEIVLNSPRYSKEIEAMKTGINDSGVNLTQKGFLKILIPVPTIEKQQNIIRDIEGRLSVCDKIEETINDSLKQAEALRQSILKKAFEGKL